jgi:hypothetical protein
MSTNDLMFKNIVGELQEIPSSYWKGIYEMLHSIRINMPKIEEEEAFDWDNLLKDIHANRQSDNQKRVACI